MPPKLLSLLGAVVLGGGGCGRATSGAPPVAFTVDPLVCPLADGKSDGKISHEDYLRAHPDLTASITVTLRELPWTPPACGGDVTDSARCAERDRALADRQTLNVKEVSCALAAFGPSGSVDAPTAYWYEPPRLQTSGAPVPVGTSFTTQALWPQIEAAARHPYIARIEPAPGEAAKLGVSAPEIPAECPAATDAPDAKLVDAASITGLGRQPVVIELREDLLPALRPCADGSDACDDLFASGWERTIVARRMLSCVRSWIDSKLEGPAADVAYVTGDGIPTGPRLPPFSDTIHATLAFGLALTWDEATEAARHPYVARAWSSPDLSVGALPAGCPPDYDAPVQPPDCSVTPEPIDGKFTAASRAEWAASTGANEVVIAVRRTDPVCPKPACPGKSTTCPELQRYTARLTEETQASQTCVRALIASIGGAATAEVFPLGDSFLAMLTWAQIQTVAADPQVAQIDRRFDGTGPP